MARPVEFDRSVARDKALVLFWRKGYQATSLTNLIDAMEISRSSFYSSFVDKRTLFLECLDLFAERTQNVVRQARKRLSPVDSLQDFFERNFTGAGVAKGRLGCMLVSTVLEMAGVDDDLADRASLHVHEMQRTFEQCLLDAGFSTAGASEMAAVLMLVNEGIRVSSRRSIAPDEQLKTIQATFRLIRNSLEHAAGPPAHFLNA